LLNEFLKAIHFATCLISRDAAMTALLAFRITNRRVVGTQISPRLLHALKDPLL
jgi:hypothetical protein